MNANKLSGYYINGNSIYYEPLQIYSESAMNPFGFDRSFLQKWWFKCARAWCAPILKVMYNENITFRRLQEQKIITMWHLEAIKIELEVTLRSQKVKKNDPPASARCETHASMTMQSFAKIFKKGLSRTFEPPWTQHVCWHLAQKNIVHKEKKGWLRQIFPWCHPQFLFQHWSWNFSLVPLRTSSK